MGIILDYVINATAQYMEHMPKKQRKAYGQFFTSKETAQFMAGLFNVPADKTEIAILDPGAGSGILSTALIERLQSVQVLQKISLTCYETDEKIIPLLKSNLEWICLQSVVPVKYKIISKNYTGCRKHTKVQLNWRPRPVPGNPPNQNVPEVRKIDLAHWTKSLPESTRNFWEILQTLIALWWIPYT